MSGEPGRIAQRLQELGITLPPAPAPAAAYVPYVRTGDLLFISGQLPQRDGALLATGLVGDTVAVDTAIECARQCAINVLAQAAAALDSLDGVTQVVKLTVMVASTSAFTEQHVVANGASGLFAEVFGEVGRHSRAALGVAVLPLGAPVEVEAILQVA